MARGQVQDLGEGYVRLCDFTGGLVSPHFAGRVDEEKYYSSCAELANFIVLPTGGAVRRSGTALVATLPIPFNDPD